MSEYISREAVDSAAKEYPWYSGLKTVLKRIPAADVRPVVPGKWERMPDNDVFGDIHCKCSACGEDRWQGPGWFRNARFCPNCGAMMEKAYV